VHPLAIWPALAHEVLNFWAHIPDCLQLCGSAAENMQLQKIVIAATRHPVLL
jgi:hypothetical protein